MNRTHLIQIKHDTLTGDGEKYGGKNMTHKIVVN